MHSPWKTMEQSQLEDEILRHETAACSANWDQNTVLIFRETGPDGAVTVSSECQNVDIKLHRDSFTRLFDLDSQEQEMILTLSWEGCVDSSACFSTCTVSVRDEPEDMFSRILNKLCTEDFTSFRQLAKVLYREYRSRLMVLRGKPLSFDIVHMNLTEYEYLQDNISVLEKNFRNLFDGDKRYDFMFDLRMHIAGGDDFTLTYPEKGFVPGMELYTEQCMRNKSSLILSPMKEDTLVSEVNSEEYLSRLYVEYEDVPINNMRPLHFHDVHGLNILVSPDSTRARRYRGFSEGICFTNRPVNINEKVCVKIVETVVWWNGVLRFGFTNIDPASHRESRLPSFVKSDLVINTGYWANAVRKEYTERKNLLCFWVNPLGDVCYSVDGEDKGVFISGVMTNSPLWAILDIYGNTCSLELIQDVHDAEDLIIKELEQHLRQLQFQRKRLYLEYSYEKSQNEEMRNSVTSLLNHQRQKELKTPSTLYVEKNINPSEGSQDSGNGAESQLSLSIVHSETNTSKLSLLTDNDVNKLHQQERFRQQQIEKDNQGLAVTETPDKKKINIQDSDQNDQAGHSTQDILSSTERGKAVPLSDVHVEDIAFSISPATKANNPFIPRLCRIQKQSGGRYGIVFASNGDSPGYFVTDVVNGSPAQAADLRVGDRIVEVNGENTESCTLNDLCEKIDRGGDETRLLVVDKATDDYYKSHRKTLNSTLPEIKHNTGGIDEVLMPRAEGLDTVLCFHASHRLGLHELQEMKKIAIEFIDGVKEIADKCDVQENIGILACKENTWIKHQPTNNYASVRETVDQLQLSGNTSLSSILQVSLEFIKENGKPYHISDVLETGPRLLVLTNENGGTSISEHDSFLAVLLKLKEECIIEDPIVWTSAGYENQAYLRTLARVTKDIYVEGNDVKTLCSFQQIQVVASQILIFKRDHRDSLSGNDELDLKFLLGMFAGHLDENTKEMIKVIVCHTTQRRGSLGSDDPPPVTERPDLPPVGSRVVRGEDWMCANEDSDGPGTITDHRDDLPGFVSVEWDNGHTGKYRCGAFNAFDVKVVNGRPRIPHSDFVICVGCEVQRGPDWNEARGNEDGGYGGVGVVISSRLDGVLTVRWHRNGYISMYKCGQDNLLEVMMKDSTVSTQESCQPSDDDAPQIHTDTTQTTSNSHHHTDENVNDTRPSTKAEDCWIWRWQDNKSHWWTYSEENSEKLERCFSCDPEGSCLIRRDKQSYRVLFKEMEEKCIGDNSRRKVQRTSNGTKHNKGQ